LSPNDSVYTRRLPAKKVRNPAPRVPLVYMPLLPAVSIDRAGAVPLVPTRGMTARRPRQMGGVCVIVGVPLLLRVAVQWT
jgi:hypothetical protein